MTFMTLLSFCIYSLDTSFMYIIACLIIVQLYSTRHPDLAAKPHIVFGTFAAIILVAVSGVVISSCSIMVLALPFTLDVLFYVLQLPFVLF